MKNLGVGNFHMLPIYPNILIVEKEILAFLNLVCLTAMQKLPSCKIKTRFTVYY